MATLGNTNITTSMSGDASQPIAFNESGLIMEVFRATGGTTSDTHVIVPRFITDIRSVVAGLAVTDDLVATNVETNVTLTIEATTATTEHFDIWVFGRR